MLRYLLRAERKHVAPMLLRYGLPALLFVLLSGCGNVTTGGRSPSPTAVVDLTVVAKALGRDEVMEAQLEDARKQLSSQLAELAEGLKQRLEEEKSKLPDKPTVEEDLKFQESLAEANLQLQETRALAQQKAQQVHIRLVRQFREEVAAVAEPLARTCGASAVLVIDEGTLWFDPSADITDEVIAELRAAVPSPGSPTPSASGALGGAEGAAGASR